MTKFYFVRHGQSTANAALIVADSTALLTDDGIEQAKRTGKELKDINIKLIVTSPYIRAQQTAETIAGEIGIPVTNIEIVEELKERFLGECEGKLKDMESERFFEIDTERGFESQKILVLRMKKALNIISKSVNCIDGGVVVVGHAISGFYLRQVAKGFTNVSDFEDYHHMNNADFTEVEIMND